LKENKENTIRQPTSCPAFVLFPFDNGRCVFSQAADSGSTISSARLNISEFITYLFLKHVGDSADFDELNLGLVAASLQNGLVQTARRTVEHGLLSSDK
jgi:hypothetical protein